jgi:hypothetical protein
MSERDELELKLGAYRPWRLDCEINMAKRYDYGGLRTENMVQIRLDDSWDLDIAPLTWSCGDTRRDFSLGSRPPLTRRGMLLLLCK